MTTPDPHSSLARALAIATALKEKKGLEVVVLNVHEASQFTHYFIVASGTSAPHLKAMAGEAAEALRTHGVTALRQTGQSSSGWMIVDGMDTVTHIFSKEARSYYGIEGLWESSPRLPIP
jgi:ribosome-associated protein